MTKVNLWTLLKMQRSLSQMSDRDVVVAHQHAVRSRNVQIRNCGAADTFCATYAHEAWKSIEARSEYMGYVTCSNGERYLITSFVNSPERNTSAT